MRMLRRSLTYRYVLYIKIYTCMFICKKKNTYPYLSTFFTSNVSKQKNRQKIQTIAIGKLYEL